MRQSRIQPTLRGANIGRLNAQQRTFVLALLADKSFNATAAAKVAAYKHPTVAASKLMKNKIVAAALGKAMRLREERTLVNADKVVVELARLAFFNTRDVFDEDGSLKPMSELSPEIACAISEVETRTTVGRNKQATTTTKYKMHSKLAALELLARHLGILKDQKIQVEGNVTIDFSDLLKQAKTAKNVIDAETIQMIATSNGNAG